MQQVYDDSISEFINIARISLRLRSTGSRIYQDSLEGDVEKSLEQERELNKAFIFFTKLSYEVSVQLAEEFGVRVLVVPTAIELGSWDIKEWISIDGKQLRTAILAAWIGAFIHSGGEPPLPPDPPIPTEKQIEAMQESICKSIEDRYRNIIEKNQIEKFSIDRMPPEEIHSELTRRFEI